MKRKENELLAKRKHISRNANELNADIEEDTETSNVDSKQRNDTKKGVMNKKISLPLNQRK